MKVKLINYTKDALELLLHTKDTRLKKELLDLDTAKTYEEKMTELNYMLKTIQSSWEFVDYVFEIEGVSRAFTHQFVRTRTGSYAQQSQRTVNVGDFEYITPKNLPYERAVTYHNTMHKIHFGYNKMLDEDIPPQDARGVLPTNVATNIIAKFNLRTLSDMAKKRLCPRTQGEYQDVFKAMRKAVIEVHPWADKFLRVYCASVGVCQFPNFKECPIKGKVFNPENNTRWDNECSSLSYTLEEIQSMWEKMDFEATPKWNGNS